MEVKKIKSLLLLWYDKVEKILMTLGTESIESLFNKGLIRDKFYPESRSAQKAGTTISYLHSLRKFYTFAIDSLR